MAPVTVVCINWRNYLGRGQHYVDTLQAMTARHLTVPHRFVCLTEAELGVELKGWWVKMRLFEPGRFTGPVLYMDLDVVLTANIDHLVERAATDWSRLWMRDDFSYSLIAPRRGLGGDTLKMLGGEGCCNSSLMLWQGGAMDGLWADWSRNAERYMSEMHGDQNVISHVLWPERIGLLPNASIQSYKYGIRMHGEPPAPVVVCHGTPKPHELNERWVTQHWR